MTIELFFTRTRLSSALRVKKTLEIFAASQETVENFLERPVDTRGVGDRNATINAVVAGAARRATPARRATAARFWKAPL